MYLLDELLEGLLLRRGPLQEQRHVIKVEVITNPPAIIARIRFRPRIAPQDNAPRATLRVRGHGLPGIGRG